MVYVTIQLPDKSIRVARAEAMMGNVADPAHVANALAAYPKGSTVVKSQTPEEYAAARAVPAAAPTPTAKP